MTHVGISEAQRRREDEQVRLMQPATSGDIERLIVAVNSGWIGRGFAIGFGMAVLGFIAGVIFAVMWGALSVGT